MSAIGSVGAVSSVASVQARIGALEHRLGVRRALPVDAAQTMATQTMATQTTATANSTSAAAVAGAASGVDVNGLLTEILGGTGQISSGQVLGQTSFDQVFNAAVERLQAQWNSNPGLGTTAVATRAAVTTSTMSATSAATGQVGVAGSVSASTPYAAEFEAAGARHGIPAKVLASIGYVESRFQLDAVSSAGAVGMMQFLPSTAAGMGVDPHDPSSAIDGAARYLRHALDRFGSLDQAIASYNVGPGAIARAGGVQPGSQAERYLQQVLDATGRV